MDVHSDSEALVYGELSMMLAYDDTPKTFCGDSRANRHGHMVATCTRDAAHEGGHTDAHSGHRWEKNNG